MALRQTTAPTSEPITLVEAKLHLRVDVNDDDALITSLIAAARQYCEMFTRRAFVNSTWRLSLDCFADEIIVPISPLSSVSSITYVDTAGATQTLSASVYSVDTYSEPGKITLAYGQSWPSIREIPNAVNVTFVAGYGSTGTSTPDTIKAAMKLLIGHWYENREAIVVGTISGPLEMAVKSLLWGERTGL